MLKKSIFAKVLHKIHHSPHIIPYMSIAVFKTQISLLISLKATSGMIMLSGI